MRRRELAIRCGLILVGVVLAWRLLRLADPTYMLWQAHVFVAIGAFAGSVPALVRACFVQRAAMTSFVLVFLLLAVVRIVYFQAVDTFSFSVAMFFLYFLLERRFRNVEVNEFFSGFQFLLALLLFVNVLDFANLHFWGCSVFDYVRAEERVGALDLSGLDSGFTVDGLFKFVGRPPGVSGTPYATSAWIAAAAIFYYVIGNRAMFLLAVLLLGGWATGSSIVVFVFVMLCLAVRRWYFPFALLTALAIALVVAKGRGLTEAYWSLEFGFDMVDFLVASVIGEGRHVSSVVSEFRIIGLLSSLGFFGVIALAGMVANYWMCMSATRSRNERTHFKAGLCFMATLMLCNWHYATLFVFPNIVFVVALFALAGSRASRRRLSESGNPYTGVGKPCTSVRVQES